MRNLSSITMDGLHSILWTVDFLKDCPRRTSGREKKSLCRRCWRMPLNISRNMSLQRMSGERNYSKKRKSGFWTRIAIGSILYENICEVLGLHPDYIRQGLMGWKEARLNGPSIQAHHGGRAKLVRTRV